LDSREQRGDKAPDKDALLKSDFADRNIDFENLAELLSINGIIHQDSVCAPYCANGLHKKTKP